MAHLKITPNGFQFIKDSSTDVFYNSVKEFPTEASIGDWFVITHNGEIDGTIKETYVFNGVTWNKEYSELMQLEGKEVFFFGDSNTVGTFSTLPFADIVSNGLKMVRVRRIGTTDIARQGTTLMKRAPINAINFANMVDWSTPTFFPQYDQNKHGLVFIGYLINDVGLNLTNYTIDNFEADLRLIVDNILAKGWAKNRIKFNIRYFLTEAGLNFTTVANSGVTVPATMQRYNEFANRMIDVLNQLEIQYFDHWDLLSSQPNPTASLDSHQRHFNNGFHALIGNNILNNLTL